LVIAYPVCIEEENMQLAWITEQNWRALTIIALHTVRKIRTIMSVLRFWLVIYLKVPCLSTPDSATVFSLSSPSPDFSRFNLLREKGFLCSN